MTEESHDGENDSPESKLKKGAGGKSLKSLSKAKSNANLKDQNNKDNGQLIINPMDVGLDKDGDQQNKSPENNKNSGAKGKLNQTSEADEKYTS